MRESDTIHLRIARALRIAFYLALILIIVSVVLKFLEIKASLVPAIIGIGLIIIAPMFGVIVGAAIVLRIKNLKFFYAALFILVIFIIAFLVGL